MFPCFYFKKLFSVKKKNFKINYPKIINFILNLSVRQQLLSVRVSYQVITVHATSDVLWLYLLFYIKSICFFPKFHVKSTFLTSNTKYCSDYGKPYYILFFRKFQLFPAAIPARSDYNIPLPACQSDKRSHTK